MRPADQPQDLAFGQAECARGLELDARHGLERAPIDLGLIGRVVQAECQDRGEERGQANDAGQSVVNDEQLQEQRRPANDLDVDGRSDPDDRRSVHAA